MRQLKRVLLIEDDPDIQTVASLSLELIGGFTVKVCSSGKEALREAENFAPDIILLDVMMPEMDGPATLIALRELPAIQTTPIVFMTAKVAPPDIAYYESLNAQGILPKPFEPMRLADQLYVIWNNHYE